MTPTIEPVYWIAFLAFIGFLLFLDLFVFHRNAHVVKVREAAIFSAFWISLGIGFGSSSSSGSARPRASSTSRAT